MFSFSPGVWCVLSAHEAEMLTCGELSLPWLLGPTTLFSSSLEITCPEISSQIQRARVTMVGVLSQTSLGRPAGASHMQTARLFVARSPSSGFGRISSHCASLVCPQGV